MKSTTPLLFLAVLLSGCAFTEHRIERELLAILIAPSENRAMKRKTAGTRWHQLSDADYAEAWLRRVRSNAVRNERGCLIWQGSVNDAGYAQTNYRAETIRVHRTIYQVFHGVKLDSKTAVCHSCDERRCIEITHLWRGTWQDNLRDCAAKNRHTNGAKTHCKQGHEYTPENTMISDAGKGRTRRNCRICHRIRLRVRSGWTREEAQASTAPIPQNAPTKRRFNKAA